MRRKVLLFLIIPLIGAALFPFFPKSEQKTTAYPITEQKAFVVIIPSYNNSPYVEKNLQSAFSQNYENYRIIYIDDHSRDDTLEKAQRLLSLHDKKKQTTLIHNPVNTGALANIYNAAHFCKNHEILVFLDGDDYFAHEDVLATLNRAYANPDTWLTYGNSLDYPSFKPDPKTCKKLPAKIIKTQSYRKMPWINTHLLTCYAALFKEIKVEDLFYRGRFYAMGADFALMLPLLEMASDHNTHIEEILYLRNRTNPISDSIINPTFQQECIKHIRSRPHYTPLQSLPTPTSQTQTADLLIFSEDNPLQLYALLESLEQHVQGLNKTTILYSSSSAEIESGYLELKLEFPKISFITKTKDFKALCNKIIFEPSLPASQHILFAQDTLVINEQIDLSKAIALLEKTHAYGLYFSLHEKLEYCSGLDRYQPIPSYYPISGLSTSLFAWQFSSGMDDWNSPNNFNFALYKKEDLKKVFIQAEYDSLETLWEEWGQKVAQDKVGLFFSTAHCVNLSLRNSTKDLLKKLHSGLKIDIRPLYHTTCASQEASAKVSFIPKSQPD